MPGSIDQVRAPKYLQLANALRERMAAGALRPGDRLPSFNEMRRDFGATQNTVEKVFALLERDGLIIREPSRGIFVAPREERPRSRTGIIGVAGIGFTFDTYSPFYAELLRGMQRAAGHSGVQILLLDHTQLTGWEKTDGVLLCDWSNRLSERIPPDHPCVSLLVQSPDRPSVIIDEAAAQAEVTRHLIGLGHKRIAYIHGADNYVVSQRQSGYRATLAEAGIVPNPRWSRTLTGNYRKAADFTARGFETMARWLNEDWGTLGCTALICQNDATAVGAMHALQEAGLTVPDDISVAGFDGIEVYQHTSPQLTTVEVPLAELGETAMRMLAAQMDAPSGVWAPPVILAAEVKVKGSTAAAKG